MRWSVYLSRRLTGLLVLNGVLKRCRDAPLQVLSVIRTPSSPPSHPPLTPRKKTPLVAHSGLYALMPPSSPLSLLPPLPPPLLHRRGPCGAGLIAAPSSSVLREHLESLSFSLKPHTMPTRIQHTHNNIHTHEHACKYCEGVVSSPHATPDACLSPTHSVP